MEMRKDQWTAVIILVCLNAFTSIIYSLQAPFYPAEAERKGASATEYGFVFGSYELTGFMVGPLAGRTMEKYPQRFLVSGGMTVTSIAIILFGLVNRIQSRVLFVTVSILLRVVEAVGTSLSTIAGFSLIAVLFPDNVSTAFSTLEIFYGCGFILGPVIGGALYTIGGFSFPFFFFGVVGIITAALILALYSQICIELPKQKENLKTISALKVPAITLNLAYVVIFMTGSGFNSALLEPHLRQFHLSKLVTSLFFIINGLAYALVAPVLGSWVDKGLPPRILLITSCILAICSFMIIGPAPFIPYNATITSCIVALTMQGFAFGACNVATFTDAFRSIRKAGFPDSIGTFGLISGLWYSSFTLGAFLGPVIGGFFYDLIGYRWATQVISVIFVVMLIVIIVFIIINYKRERDQNELLIDTAESTPLLMENK